MSHVAGVGTANFDILYSQVPRLPKEGEEVYAKGFQIQLGGGVPATLINLQRLGVKVKLITFLGQDMFSEFVKEELEKSGIEYVNLYKGEGIPLSISSVMITKQDRSFMSYSDSMLLSEKMEESIFTQLQGAKAVEMLRGPLEPYRKLKAAGTKLIFDVGWEDDLSIEKYREYLELADYFTPNQKEALKLTGALSVEDAAKRLGDFFDDVIIKLDQDGCMYRKNGETTIISPLPDVKAVDATGAGDAFLSGFLYGIFHGNTVLESIKFGNVTGGTCVQGIGCLSSYVTEDEMLQKVKKIKCHKYR